MLQKPCIPTLCADSSAHRQAASSCHRRTLLLVPSIVLAGMELTRTGPGEVAGASGASSADLEAKLAAANAKLADSERALKEVPSVQL